jgi:hypothetical protein
MGYHLGLCSRLTGERPSTLPSSEHRFSKRDATVPYSTDTVRSCLHAPAVLALTLPCRWPGLRLRVSTAVPLALVTCGVLFAGCLSENVSVARFLVECLFRSTLGFEGPAVNTA